MKKLSIDSPYIVSAKILGLKELYEALLLFKQGDCFCRDTPHTDTCKKATKAIQSVEESGLKRYM